DQYDRDKCICWIHELLRAVWSRIPTSNPSNWLPIISALCRRARRHSCSLRHCASSARPKEKREQDEDYQRASRRNVPDRVPVVRHFEAFVRRGGGIAARRIRRRKAIH